MCNCYVTFDTLFDVNVKDNGAQSYSSHLVTNVLVTAEEERKQKYGLVDGACHAFFSLFVVSVDGVLCKEAVLFL